MVRRLEPSMVRLGDTASGQDPQTDEVCLWRCVLITALGTEWESLGPWTEEGSSLCIQDADALCVVPE